MKRFIVIMIAGFSMTSSAQAIKFQSGMNTDYLAGSFHATCSQCKVYPNGLFCSCQNIGGGARFSRLNLTFCANAASIRNDSTELHCDPIIRGSWGQSCLSGVIFQDSISAKCKTKTGDIKSTTLNLLGCPSLKLENIDGNLQCMQ